MTAGYSLKRWDLFLVVLSVSLVPALSVLGEEAASQNELIIGVLEYYHPMWSDEPRNIISKENPTYKRQVRILFKKTGTNWEAFEHDFGGAQELSGSIRFYPASVNWFVAFNGKSISQFRSTRPNDIKWYRDVGLHIPDPNANMPVVGKLSKEFSGFLHDSSLRPLVLVSQNHTSDPDHWKPAHPLDRSLARRCFPEFRKIHPTVDVGPDEAHEVMSPYEDKVILVNKAYSSSNGEYLIALSIDPAFRHNTGTPLEELPADWFYLDKQKTAHALGGEMRLVDAGDYDNDGSSEVLFWKTDYDDEEDGYVLFYDHFSRNVTFSWHYH